MSLTYGKYKDQLFSDIAESDPNYLKWLHGADENLRGMIESVLDVSDIYLNFGKYRNKSLRALVESDPKYCEYLKNNDYVKKNRHDIIAFLE